MASQCGEIYPRQKLPANLLIHLVWDFLFCVKVVLVSNCSSFNRASCSPYPFWWPGQHSVQHQILFAGLGRPGFWPVQQVVSSHGLAEPILLISASVWLFWVTREIKHVTNNSHICIKCNLRFCNLCVGFFSSKEKSSLMRSRETIFYNKFGLFYFSSVLSSHLFSAFTRTNLKEY